MKRDKTQLQIKDKNHSNNNPGSASIMTKLCWQTQSDFSDLLNHVCIGGVWELLLHYGADQRWCEKLPSSSCLLEE